MWSNIRKPGVVLLVFLFASAAACGCEDTASPPRLYRVENGMMVTSDGHVLLLRGVNVSGVAKSTDDHLFDLTSSDVDNLLSSGINVVRMLTFWKAVTPESPSAVDGAYLEAFAAQVRMLTDAGLYVVVDMHQDLWGVPFVSHGAPSWACPDEITEGYEPISPWWMNYTTAQVTGCFDLFWSDPALQDRFIDAWTAMAGAVCPDDRVLGFDLLNEPYPGSALFDEDFDNAVLMPFYVRVMERIERVCPGRLYFVEPSAAFVLGFALPLEIPEPFRDRVVWAGHFYPQEVHEPDGPGYDGHLDALETQMRVTVQDQLDANVPVWVGEYGGVTTVPNFEAYIQDINTLFAQNNVSAVLWDYYAGDGGFAFLDATGRRKALFDPVFGTPMPTELPSVPSVNPDWANRSVALSFVCGVDRHLTMLFPMDGCLCAVTPDHRLGQLVPEAGFVTASCTSDGPVELTCTCGG